MKSVSESYAAAGVDVTAGYKAVELMKAHVARTNIPGVLSGIGGFEMCIRDRASTGRSITSKIPRSARSLSGMWGR